MSNEVFESSSDMKVPPDDTVVWRYMDFTKLLLILEIEKLFFPSVEKLRHVDPWEGSWSNFRPVEVVGGHSEWSRRAIEQFQ
jgi:hypothetical protein